MTKWLTILGLVVMTSLVACSKGVDVVVTFATVPDVQSGDAVMLEGVQIGKVSKLEPVDQGSRIHLSLDPDKSKSLRTHSAAMVVQQDSTKVVEVFNSATGDSPLPPGHELLAINSTLELLAWQAGDAIDETSRQLSETISSLQDYFSGPEWQKQRKQLREELAEVERSVGRSAQEFGSELETMLKSLESKSSATARELNEQFDTLKNDLDKLSEELVREGKETLLPALDRMLMTLRETLERYQSQKQTPPHQKQSP